MRNSLLFLIAVLVAGCAGSPAPQAATEKPVPVAVTRPIEPPEVVPVRTRPPQTEMVEVEDEPEARPKKRVKKVRAEYSVGYPTYKKKRRRRKRAHRQRSKPHRGVAVRHSRPRPGSVRMRAPQVRRPKVRASRPTICFPTNNNYRPPMAHLPRQYTRYNPPAAPRNPIPSVHTAREREHQRLKQAYLQSRADALNLKYHQGRKVLGPHSPQVMLSSVAPVGHRLPPAIPGARNSVVGAFHRSEQARQRLRSFEQSRRLPRPPQPTWGPPSTPGHRF